MRPAANRHQAIARIVFDMEAEMRDVQKWARVLRDLGLSSESAHPDGLYVIGEALRHLGKQIEERFDTLFELTRPDADGTGGAA